MHRFVRRFGWVAYLTITAAVALLYLFLQHTPLHSGPVFNLLGLSTVAAIAVGALTHRVLRLPWALIAIGQAAFVTGDVLAYNYTRFFGTELPFPSIADLFYLATYPFLIAGLVLLIRKRTPTHDRASLIDTLIVSMAAGALSWALLISPYAHDATLSTGTKLTSIAYPVLDLGVLACVIRFAFARGHRPLSFYLLTTGVVSLFATDSIYGWFLLHGGYDTGAMLDAGWIAFYILTGAAVLHGRMPTLVEPAPDTQFRLTRRRIVALASCSIVAPAVLVAQAFRGTARDVPLLAGAAAGVFLLIVLRLLDLVKRHETALLRATVLAEAGAELVEAQTRADVADAATSAAQRMIGTESEIRLAEAGDAVGARNAHDERVLALALRGKSEVRGTLVVRTPRRCDADTAEALRALASEAALALDGVAMAEHLLEQRIEARFQSLVQNSSDLILVVDRAGRIDFASPSTRRVFGEASGRLEGQPLVDLVAEQDRTRVAHAVFGEVTSASLHTLEFELETRRGSIEVEATCTNLLDDDNVGGIVLNIRDVSERKEFERQLAHQAFHDELTGLANRALFHDRVEHALTRTHRQRTPLAVLFIDIDEFKTVNDTLGHGAGDRLLRAITERIAGTIRAVDTAARLGGDEFAILLEGQDGGDAAQVADRLQEAFLAPVELDGKEFVVTASVGIAQALAGSDVSVETLLRNADVAMYAAKEDGKGACRIFEPDMHTAVLERLELRRALQLAIERDEFELHYQPIVDLNSGAIISLEALIRWRHPERGLMPPGHFIPLAEETGLIVPIGGRVLEQACTEAAKLVRLAGDAAPSISVNLSGRQLQRPELVDTVREILNRTGLPPAKLVLEITETVMMADLDLALIKLQELKDLGLSLAVDDFGSGYSSLNYIRRFPIDILKVDKSFIADVDKPGEVASLTRTIIELGEILNVTPVAEGIEESTQLEELRRMGCPLGQGFFFMKPVEAGVIEAEILGRLARPEGTPLRAANLAG